MKLARVNLVATSILLALPRLAALADTLIVPSAAYPTIQSAIDAASKGDAVVIAPGTYHETINFLGKAITVRTSDGPVVTILDGTGLSGSVVLCVANEGPESVLEGFTITGGTGDTSSGFSRGGALYVREGRPTIRNCTFTDNSAYRGGAVSLRESQAIIEGCRFTANSAEFGGGLELSSDNSVIRNCEFRDNVADGGGALYTQRSTGTITSCLFEDNQTAITGPFVYDTGGAVLNYLSAPTFVSCTFDSNEAKEGGAIYNQESTLTVDACTFDRNQAETVGGAISSELSDLVVVGSTFKTNSAGYRGGAIDDVVGGSLKVERSSFHFNSADLGGGIGTSATYGVLVRSSLFQSNGAGSHGGAVYFNFDSHGVVEHCTFTNNHASFGSAAAFGDADDFLSDPSEFSIVNSILADSGGELSINDGSCVMVTYSNVHGGFPGLGNIDVNPRFYGYEDFRLWPSSPCINAGDPALGYPVSATDIADRPRSQGCRADMGAYESAVHQATGDYDGNRSIDLRDFAAFQSCLGAMASGGESESLCVCVFDTAANGVVDLDDYSALNVAWGEGPRPPPRIDRLFPLPGEWVVGDGGLDRVQFGFTEPVIVPGDAITVWLASAGIGAYKVENLSAAYDSASDLWSIAFEPPLRDDRVTVVIDYSVTGVTGSELDGEMHDAYLPVLPTGDGYKGGQAVFRVHVLQGDANRDGVVDGFDEALVNDSSGLCEGAIGFETLADLNQDGCVDAADALIVGDGLGRELPWVDGIRPHVTEVYDYGNLFPFDTLTVLFSERVDSHKVSERSAFLVDASGELILPTFFGGSLFGDSLDFFFIPAHADCNMLQINLSDAVFDLSGELLQSMPPCTCLEDCPR